MSFLDRALESMIPLAGVLIILGLLSKNKRFKKFLLQCWIILIVVAMLILWAVSRNGNSTITRDAEGNIIVQDKDGTTVVVPESPFPK